MMKVCSQEDVSGLRYRHFKLDTKSAGMFDM